MAADLTAVVPVVVLLGLLAGLRVVRRAWKASGIERYQLRWRAYGVVFSLILFPFAVATAPDRAWLTTEHPTAEGKLCLRAVNDVYSNCIAGYSMDDGPAVSVLRNALGVDRRVDWEATKFQWNQCFPRHLSCCLCRQRPCGVGACLS